MFETRMATGSEQFSLLTCFRTTTFTLLGIFSPLEMISTKIWETPLSWHVKCSLPVAVRVPKTRVLKLLNGKGATPDSGGQAVQFPGIGQDFNLSYPSAPLLLLLLLSLLLLLILCFYLTDCCWMPICSCRDPCFGQSVFLAETRGQIRV